MRNQTRDILSFYLHDGQNLFDEAVAPFGEWGVDETMLELEKDGFEAIVIGIDHGTKDRINEYSAYAHAKHGGGKGLSYLKFLVETLKPTVDKEFRTIPDREHTFIGGSSLGRSYFLLCGY